MDFPQIDLPTLEAECDIDWDGNGVYSLREALECPCCGISVKVASGYAKALEVTVLTCPNCVHELGVLESV